MKTIKNLVFGALIAMTLFVPSQTWAKEREKDGGKNDNDNHKNSDKHSEDNDNSDRDNSNYDRDNGNSSPSTSGNSVPVNGGLVVLFAAGLGLGVKIIHDKNKKKEIKSSSI